MRGYQQSLITTLAPLVDGLLVAGTGWLAFFARWGKWNLSLNYGSVLILCTGLALILLPATGAYKSWRSDIHWRDTGKVLPGLFAVAALLAIAGTLTKSNAEFSRLWMVYWFVFAVIALFLFRWLVIVLANLLQLDHTQGIKILIVGNGEFAHAVAQKVRTARDAKWEIAGFISPHSHNFCHLCNRVRVTAEGRLLLCLGNEHSVDLRGVMRAPDYTLAKLKQTIVDAMAIKPERHHFDLSTTPDIVRFMNTTGG